MIYTDIVQGTPEWADIRRGKITASRLGDLLARTKSGPSASRQNYLAEIICEILTGKTPEGYTNAAMERGRELEPLARSAYEATYGVMVTEVGFASHPDIDRYGASPDGLVDDDGMVEIKCLNAARHLALITGKAQPDSDYVYQMQGGMACADRLWCDFVAYNPDFPARHQLYVRRYLRDPSTIITITSAIIEALAEIDAAVAALS